MTETLPEITPGVKAASAVLKKYGRRSTWERARNRGIGASETPIILGLTTWGSPLEIWERKTGRGGGVEITERMEWGSRLEPVIAAAYKQQTNREVTNAGSYTIHWHPEIHYLFASLDREQTSPDCDGPGVLEIKTASAWTQDEWVDEPPLSYLVQVQHQLAVTGYAWGTLCVLLGGQEMRWFDVPRNDTLIEQILWKLDEFWVCVENDTPPPIDGNPNALRRIMERARVDGKAIVLDPDAVDLVQRYLAMDARRKDFDRQSRNLKPALDEAKACILDAMGDAAIGDGPGFQVRVAPGKVTKYIRVDAGQLDAIAEAGIPHEMKTTTYSPRLTVKEFSDD